MGNDAKSGTPPLSYKIFLTSENSLYGIYLNGRSSHVGVMTTERRCEKTLNDSRP